MKFYTLAVYQETYFNGCDNDNCKAQGLADTAYQQRIKSLNGVLSPRLMELATLPDVDDGRIVEAHFIHALQELIFILRCGDLQMGDFDLVLRYKGVTLTQEHEQTLARLARAKNLRSSRAPDTGCMKRLERKSRNYLYYTPDGYGFFSIADILCV